MTEELLLQDILFASAGRTPNRVAISHGDDQVTFAEMARRVVHLTDVLAARKVRRGDRVAWWGNAHIDAAALYYGAAVLGAVFVPLNPGFNSAEAAAILDLAEPTLVVTDEDHRGDVVIEGLLGEHPAGGIAPAPAHETDPDVIFFTSGTTGAPKGVVLTQRTNWLRTTAGVTHPATVMSMFPQFHWAGWSFLHSAWYSGSHYVLVDGGDTEALLRAIEARRVEKFYAIPAVWRRILDAAPASFDTTSLRQVDTGTSSTPPDLLAEIAEAFPGTTTQIGYGATEAGGICVLAPEDLHRKPGSVNGELWVKSPQAFSGYYRNPEGTAEVVMDGGWYRTGDVVQRDDEGYLSVVGRIKEQIRTGGEFVAPPEVELVVQRHPSVADAAVAGVPHPDWGEVVTAFVVLRPGHQIDLADLRRHCQASMASFKVPRRLLVVDEIPRTGSTGKVLRRQLVALAAAHDRSGEAASHQRVAQ